MLGYFERAVRAAMGFALLGSIVVGRANAAPVLTVPANMFVEATGPSGAVVNFPLATATETLPRTVVSITYSPLRGSVFPLGQTTDTVTATNDIGEFTTGTFKITVMDSTAPSLTVPSNISVTSPDGSPVIVNYAAANATDAVTASPNISYSKASGTLFPIGTTTVNVSATDDAFNSTSKSFTVTVTTAPEPATALFFCGGLMLLLHRRR